MPMILAVITQNIYHHPSLVYTGLSGRSEIWQALRQHCCRCACQVSKRYDNSKNQSRGLETLRDLTKRRLFGYWDGAQAVQVDHFCPGFLRATTATTSCGIEFLDNLKPSIFRMSFQFSTILVGFCNFRYRNDSHVCIGATVVLYYPTSGAFLTKNLNLNMDK